jgi:RNA polymerase sigma-B factor
MMAQEIHAAVSVAGGTRNRRSTVAARRRYGARSPTLDGRSPRARVVPIDRAIDRARAPAPGRRPSSPQRSADGARPFVGDGPTRALLREYHERRNLRARERLIQKYMPLVKSLARRYSKRGEQYEDLVQVGAIGLIKAVDRFELQRDVELAAFAIPNISGEILRHLRDRGWPVRVPRRLQALRPDLRACEDELVSQLERPATIPEISKRAGVEEAEVAAALATERVHAPVSLSESTRREPGGEEEGYELGEQRAVLAAGFRILDERERRVVHLQFFEGLSQPQTAREVGISQIHVSRLTRQALAKMRAEIGAA